MIESPHEFEAWVRTASQAELDAKREELLRQITELNERRKIQLGLHGVPNSGKTSLLIAWYLFRDDREFGLNIRFTESAALYLRNAATHFLENGTTQANPVVTPDTIRFFVKTDEGEEFEIETQDFAGRLVEPIESQSIRKLANEARSFLERCTAIICLLDCGLNDRTVLDAIDLLPDDKPVIFAPTKVDELLPDPQSLLDVSRAQSNELYEQVSQQPVIAAVEQQLRVRRAEERFKCVPLSPFGPIFRNGKLICSTPLKSDDLRPWNVYLPLQMLVAGKLKVLRSKYKELAVQLDEIAKEQQRRTREEEQRKVEAEQSLHDERVRAERTAEVNRLDRDKRKDKLRGEIEELELQAEEEGVGIFGLSRRVPTWLSRLREIEIEANELKLTSVSTRAREFSTSLERRARWMLVLSTTLFVFLACAALAFGWYFVSR